MIEKHIEYLLKNDANFINFWDSINRSQKEQFLTSMYEIDTYKSNDKTKIENEVINTQEVIKRIFYKVPNINLTLFNIPFDWNRFIKSQKNKEQLFRNSKKELKRFLNKYGFSNHINFYGNIKTNQSLDNKIMTDYIPTTSTSVRDIWDIVRFRFITNDLYNLLIVSLAIWDEYYNVITKCHNYYSNPKNMNPLRQYRGVHFEIEVTKGRIIEIQVITRRRDYISQLDHSIYFKKSVPFMNQEHANWFEKFLLKAVVYDAHELIDNDLEKLKLPLTMYKNNSRNGRRFKFLKA
jgi:ppGpp synthetase/RelA/SpoT-type nucleotidyltranferase